MANSSTASNVLADKKLNEQLVEHLQTRLRDLPDGSLCSKIIRGKERLYHYTYSSDNLLKGKPAETQSYLSKEDHTLKEALQQKAFIEKALVNLKHNLAVQVKFLTEYHPFNPIEIIENLPKACRNFDLVKTMNHIDFRDSDVTNEWPQQPETDKPLYASGLLHCTSKGIKVRSKSESIIATLLDMNGLEYRYELPLTLDDHTFYPDFTIVRSSDRKLFYWEHFGMMSNRDYHEQAQKKLQEYIKHNLMPWDRLIATFESEQDTFDAQQIDKIIKALLV